MCSLLLSSSSSSSYRERTRRKNREKNSQILLTKFTICLCFYRFLYVLNSTFEEKFAIMRAGLSTIQQTLTPEAATVLNHSISEASRRNHGQTTPLHVAATLLSSPSGYLRQACIRSHPNSSHPLQCRALELCFSVALERLPTAQNMVSGTEPPISNALMAALKRAQAHQRRGCPEQQQQPLLAVKVELEQLIISILDDPSVSRVMREASFSSPAVKNTIEQSLTQTQTSSSSQQHHYHQTNVNLSPFTAMGGGSRILGTNPVAPVQITRNMYLNPKLQAGGGGGGGGVGQLGNLQRGEEVKRVLEILLRSKKRNPVLVGEGEPEGVVKELFSKIEKGELGEGHLKNLQIIQMEKEFSFSCDKIQMLNKITELQRVIESKMSSSSTGGGGVILDLGDLKWLVEQQQPMISEIGKAVVTEMGKLLARFREEFSNRLWLIGTATCETYLRCQVYHSTMENDWDLQAVPIASRSPHPGIFPRLGNERILGSSLDPLNPLKSFTGPVPLLARRAPENVNPRLRTSCCPQCKEKFEHELAKLVSEFENSSSEAKSESPPRPQLPQWLQSAKLKNDSKPTTLSQIKDQGLLQQKTQELQKKWNDTCLQLHPNFQHNAGPQRTVPPVLSMPGLYNPNLLLRQPLQPKLVPSRSLGASLQLNTTQMASQSLEKAASPPGSPVRTDLALGPKPSETVPEKTLEDQAKDFLSCISSVPQNKLLDKFASALDADTFKRLLKGLMEKAWWQQDAASSVASAVSRCRLGNGKQRGGAPKGDIWLLFTGPDRYAKRKMASVLSEQMCGNSPIMISLGSRRDDEESDVGFRGKTAVDRIAEAVRRNPLSVIMLEDIDEANVLVRGSIKRAMDRGRLTDSHGREISLGNVIFILTGNWSTMSPESYRNEYLMEEKKLVSLASSDWQLRLTVGEKSSAKRRASWLHDEDRPRKELNLGLSFDLNEAADLEDYRTDGSHNSSDVTVEREEEPRRFSVTSVPHELVSSVDDTIPFKPIEFMFARREIKKTISKKFSMVVDDKVSIEVEDDIVDRILGGLWRGRTSLEQWVEKVLGPSFDQIQPRLPSSDENAIVRLQLELLHTDSNSHHNGECLPSKVTIVADGQ